MDKTLSAFMRKTLLRGALAAICTIGISSAASAGPRKIVKGTAAGQITSQLFCSATELCQENTVSGAATQIGSFVGTLTERIDLTTGTYTGEGLFVTADGTFQTTHAGQVTQPDEEGRVFFFETHEIVSGTGRFAGSTGQIHVAGTADAQGKIRVLLVGSISFSR